MNIKEIERIRKELLNVYDNFNTSIGLSPNDNTTLIEAKSDILRSIRKLNRILHGK